MSRHGRGASRFGPRLCHHSSACRSVIAAGALHSGRGRCQLLGTVPTCQAGPL